ncbi:hypothetical protein HAX54_038556 [Datura stramonium]|uniref:Uncharacterized protein n=1 Tax=Datura stramonium TaxID=4076 RepID=A0ABS8SI39_DATST|nr:hypothetical protein [Datura stramonium]
MNDYTTSVLSCSLDYKLFAILKVLAIKRDRCLRPGHSKSKSTPKQPGFLSRSVHDCESDCKGAFCYRKSNFTGGQLFSSLNDTISLFVMGPTVSNIIKLRQKPRVQFGGFSLW